MSNIDRKQLRKKLKRILKDDGCICLFSTGSTLIQGDEDMCISSIAWSLNTLKRETPEFYNKVMSEIEEVEKYKNMKEVNKDVK